MSDNISNDTQMTRDSALASVSGYAADREYWWDKWSCVLNQSIGYIFLAWFDWRIAAGCAFVILGRWQSERIMRIRRHNAKVSDHADSERGA